LIKAAFLAVSHKADRARSASAAVPAPRHMRSSRLVADEQKEQSWCAGGRASQDASQSRSADVAV